MARGLWADPRGAAMVAILLGLAPIAPGVGGCDDGADDDSADDDDDATDDDDDVVDDDDSGAGDDDDSASPCDVDPDGWLGLPGAEDPQGDAGGYLCDLADVQAQLVGDVLYLRATAHEPFDDDDPALMLDLRVGDGDTWYTLTWDNVQPDPGPLQLWGSSNDWAEPLEPPSSLRMCPDDDDALTLGVALADLGLDGATELRGFAGVDLWSGGGYRDVAPDEGAVTFSLLHAPDVRLLSVTLDDAAGGDGDGVVEAGELLELSVEITNGGGVATGGDVTVSLDLDESSTAAATVTVPSSTVAGGAPLEPYATAALDTPLRLQLDGAATTGQTLVLELTVTDGDGGSWVFLRDPDFVGAQTVLVDGDDFDYPLDLASAEVFGDAATLHVVLRSHGPHDGAQPAQMLLDTDLDATFDWALTTYDDDSGAFDGAIWAHDEAFDTWSQVGQPTAFDFVADTAYVHWTVDLADLGDPGLARAYAYTTDASDTYVDNMPDDPDDVLGLALLVFEDQPVLQLIDRAWTEVAGDGDAFIDPGESWALDLQVRNVGTLEATAAAATLTSTSALVTVVAGQAGFGDVATGATAWTLAPLVVDVSSQAPPWGSESLDLELTSGIFSSVTALDLPLGLHAGDTTADAPEIPAPGSYAGDTTSRVDDYQDPSACTGFSAGGNDAVVAVSLALGQVLDVDLTYDAGGPDAVLYVSDDPLAPDTACLEGADLTVDESESLSFTAPYGGLFYVVVDAFDTDDGGPFTLDLSF